MIKNLFNIMQTHRNVGHIRGASRHHAIDFIVECALSTCFHKICLIFFCYRATGVAISMISARLGGIIGNIVIAQLLDLYCPAPTFIVSVLLAGGGLLCLMLPNTTRTALS